MNIEQLYQIFCKHSVVTTDSRNIPDGSLFFALKGKNFDGNSFAAEAIQKGADYAVVDDPELEADERFILVNDVLTSFQQLAHFHRKKLGIPILAITGTNGKTTTKELLSIVLAEKYNTSFTKGNLNNHIGVPLTILAMNDQTEIGIVEMGANHPGEIDELCRIAEPDYGLITNVGKAHLEGFGSFEGVVRTKSEMYRFLKENGGKCFVNADNDILMDQSEGVEQITYGRISDNFLSGEVVESDYNVVVKALFPQGWLFLQSKLVGGYNAENVLAAACVGKYFEIDPLKIQKAIAVYLPSNNRSQFIRKESNTLILDAYNANPTSMKAALESFVLMTGGNKCLILGDMLELGEASSHEHQMIVDLIQTYQFDHVFLVGKCFNSIISSIEGIHKFEDTTQLIDYLSKWPLVNKLILIKGSRGIRLEKVVDAL